ncbi:cell division protein ZapA [Enterovirga aerilata]|uniref:Cell division protein ZapA n=1 Tax=Enterovirga aerilata TaxID=2730920 RepID=A0A849I900_9HYPH|nr:cell division protein ZapA [Enterovirga sp. DB1703]NNM74274.1 cell division protein ZapA [Enterovirga sp. DB1703]
MAHVQVTIAGRSYRMACGDGEEGHLLELAAAFDGKIQELRAAFGEIGDMRLHVMAALTMADDLIETRKRISTLESEISALRSMVSAQASRSEAAERQLAEALNRTADRIERVTDALAEPRGGQDFG